MHEVAMEDYTLHNTQRLGVEDVVKVVGSLPEVQEELGDWEMSRPIPQNDELPVS